jgi:hypothetical protein
VIVLALLSPSLVAALFASTGCTRWQRIEAADIEGSGGDLVGQKLLVHMSDGTTVDILVSDVDPPWLIGNDYKNGFFPAVRVDLSEVERIEIEHPEAELGNTVLVVVSILAVTTVIVLFIFASAGTDETSLFHL